MNLKEMLKEAIAEMTEVKKSVEKGVKTADDLQAAIAKVKELQEKVKAADEAEELMKGLNSNGAATPANREEKGTQAPRTIGDNFVEVLKKNNARKNGQKFRYFAPAFKAATDIQTSPAGAVDFATTFDRNVVTAPRIDLVIRDLFGAETISGSTLVYLVEGAMEGEPAETAEGAKKAQVHFADPDPKTVSLKKITEFIKESDEYINDYPFLASAINGRLLYALGLKEQNTLVTDLLATSGIQTGSIAASATATAIADEILKAAMDVQEQSGFPATAIAMNPTMWYNLRVAKDGENRYYGGGFFGPQSVPNLWGFPVCVTPSIAASKIVVGAFKTCGSVVSRDGVSVEATNSNEDDFIKNLMTIRAEERLALAVRRPAGFKVLRRPE